jgi:hypothetical protein
MNLDKALKLLAILASADQEAFDASAMFSRYAAEGVEVTLMGTDPERADTRPDRLRAGGTHSSHTTPGRDHLRTMG